ncbi:MAG: glycerophosphodiester phosphodiesterase [Acidobacteriota bacterium]
MPTSSFDRLVSLTTPVAIAHRGGSKLNPENTLAAFGHAVMLGVDAIECDVRLSKDGEVVVIHDETVDRTTNRTGRVGDFTATELASFDAGHHFGADAGFPRRGQGIGVPRLLDALHRWPEVPFVVEIKGDRVDDAKRVIEAVQAAGAETRVMIGGFDLGVLRAVRTLAPNLITSASSLEVRAALRRAILFLKPRPTGYLVFQVPFVFRGRRILRRAFVRAARRAGVPVHAWVVDDPIEMRRLLDWGVSGLISDRPDLAVAARDEANDTRGRV